MADTKASGTPKKTSSRSKAWPKPTAKMPIGLGLAALLIFAACLAASYAVRPAHAPGVQQTRTDGGALTISEVMTSNRSAVADDTGAFWDWVELVNPTSGDVDVTGWTLTDGEDRLVGFTFPKQVLKSGEYVIVYCSGAMKNTAGYAYHAPFRLSAQGETLILKDGAGAVVDQLTVPPLSGNEVYARSPSGEWTISTAATPGLENTERAYRQWMAGRGSTASGLMISEAMSANRTYADSEGACFDYIELHNAGGSAVDLSGYTLSDDQKKPAKWRFPSGSRIEAGEYKVLYASGQSKEGHLSFKLSSSGEEVILSNPDGRMIDQVTLPGLSADRAYSRIDGIFTADYPPTPGCSNDQEGLNQTENHLRQSNRSGLILNEAVSSARAQNAGSPADDWVELYNTGSDTVDLSGYGLSDNPDRPRKWQFPKGASIGPGQYLVVLLNGLDKYDLPKNLYAANFKLSYTAGQTLTLSDPAGNLIDRLPMVGQVSAVSFGRIEGGGYYYLETMTPGEPNAAQGKSGRVGEISFSQKGGWFDAPVTVSLSAEPGVTIRYTLDATEPTEQSGEYLEPITVSENTVIRAKGFRDGYISSLTATASYLFGTKHTLPVVSLVTDPAYLYDPKIGIYTMGEKELKYPYKGANFFKNWERAAHVEYFGTDGTTILNQGVGLALQGQYSRMEKQKAFKITARNAYGPNRFNAALFPNRSYTSYRSFILRASGQDSQYTRMRDSILTSLAEPTDIMYQDGFPVIVYVNGGYFGHYNMRERIHKYSIAQWEGWSNVDDIEIKGNGGLKQGGNSDYTKMLAWLKKNGCTTPENLAIVEESVDVDNYLDYVALEMYLGNTDLLNVKRYRSSSEGDGRWQWILYDTDWAFYTDTDSFRRWLDPKGVGSGNKADNTLFVQLMKNTDIRQKFLTRLGELMYSSWRSDLVLAKIDARYQELLPEMPAQFEKWGGSMSRWKTNIKKFRNYAAERPKKLLTYIKKELGWSRDEMHVYFGDIMDEMGM